MISAYLATLSGELRTRGRARRRFLEECRQHLADLEADLGAGEAVEAFGDPRLIAAEFDREVAARRSITAAWWVVLGVLATGASTLALIHSADPAAHAPWAWALVFAGAAQVAATCTALVAVHALRLRKESSSAADVALLCRRAAVALVAAGLTMFAAGAALPGRGSAVTLLAGPVLACAAVVLVLRARSLARRLGGARVLVARSAFADARALTGLPVPVVGPFALAAVAAVAAFARDLGEAGSTTAGSVSVGAIEAALVLVSYAALRKPLGLSRP